MKAGLCSLLMALSMCAIAEAAPGDRDRSFSRDGLQSVPPAQGPPALAVAADSSSILAFESANSLWLQRFDAAGRATGLVAEGLAEIGLGGATGPALAAEPPGSLLTAATSNTGDFVLARVVYASEGAESSPHLAPSLDGDGIAFVDLSSPTGNELTDLSVGPDGAIAVAGIVEGPEGAHVGVGRLRSDGTPLPGFGDDGLLLFPEGGGFSEQVQVLALPADRTLIAAAGPAPDGSGAGDLLVARLDATGGFDPGFGGGDGWLTIDVAGRDDARSLTMLADGRIAAGFQACAFGLHTTCRDAVAVLSAGGEPDPGFGVGGLVDGVPGSQVADGGEGRVLVGGASEFREFFQRDFALTRLLADGSPDPGFAGGGTTRVDFGLTEDRATAIALSPDGRPVLGGVAGEGAGVARFVTAAGPPDADGDRHLDDADRCPERFAGHRSGCPELKRTLKLRSLPGRRVAAKLRSPIDACEVRRRVRVIQMVAGLDGVIARGRTNKQGIWRSPQRLPEGRYRAVVKGGSVRAVGRCEIARSGELRVG
jgi:uncharacterized delta-60 repeat protein